METENARTQSYLTYEEIWDNEEENFVRDFEKAQHSTDILLEQYNKDLEEVGEFIGTEDSKKEFQIKNYIEVNDKCNKHEKNTRDSISKITRAVLKEERENKGFFSFKRKKS